MPPFNLRLGSHAVRTAVALGLLAQGDGRSCTRRG